MSWDPPIDTEQNGNITSYNVTYIGNPIDSTSQFEITVTSSENTHPATSRVSTDLTGLQEFNNYTIQVEATNVVGSGPYSSEVVNETFQASKLNCSLTN